MKILLAQEYVNRILFVLEHQGKYIQVYRSSGLSGTGHNGKILPFAGLNTEKPRFRGEPLGYIWKEMFYDKKWVSHYKNLGAFGLLDKMEYIREFLAGVNYDKGENIDEFKLEDDKFDYERYEDFVSNTNNKLKEARGNLEPFDLSEDI